MVSSSEKWIRSEQQDPFHRLSSEDARLSIDLKGRDRGGGRAPGHRVLKQCFHDAVQWLDTHGGLNTESVERLKEARPMRTLDVEDVIPGHVLRSAGVTLRVEQGSQRQISDAS